MEGNLSIFVLPLLELHIQHTERRSKDIIIIIMRTSLLGFSLSRIFRQLEGEMETVVRVLQPGPLGIIEHKFSAEEIREAEATVRKAVQNWRQIAELEQRSQVLKDFIQN